MRKWVIFMKTLDNSGYTLVFMTLAMVFILGITALVTDVGITVFEKQKLNNAVDAATLAAMQDIGQSDQVVINTAKQYASLNGEDPNQLNVTINPDRKGISVQSNKSVNYFFAKILGYSQGTVNAQAKAKISPITAFTGIRPLAVADQTFVYGQQYTLKDGAGGGNSGNYGALALGGNGACVYKNNLMYGYQGSLKVGDTVYTEPGNIAGPTQQAIQYLISEDPLSTYDNFQNGSPRLLVIPVVNTLNVNGKKPVTIVGFAAFFLEGTSGSGGYTQVIGRFIKYVAGNSSGGIESDDGENENEYETDDNQTDYGLDGFQLTN